LRGASEIGAIIKQGAPSAASRPRMIHGLLALSVCRY
jgi:hypothetical protein